MFLVAREPIRGTQRSLEHMNYIRPLYNSCVRFVAFGFLFPGTQSEVHNDTFSSKASRVSKVERKEEKEAKKEEEEEQERRRRRRRRRERMRRRRRRTEQMEK